MICSQCGKSLPEGTKFCDGCGNNLQENNVLQGQEADINTNSTQTQGVNFNTQQQNQNINTQQSVDFNNSQSNQNFNTQQQSAQQAFKQQINTVKNSTIVKKCLSIIKGFFSKKLLDTVKESAKSTGNEWILLAVVNIIIFSFALAINSTQFMSSITKFANGLFNAGSLFGMSLLYGLISGVITYFLFSGVLFGGLRLVLKKNVNFVSILNLVSTACLALSSIYIVNIILGFVWMTITMVLSITAIFAVIILIYEGVQNMEYFEKPPIITYTCVLGLVTLVVLIMTNSVIQAYIENIIANMFNSFNFLF